MLPADGATDPSDGCTLAGMPGHAYGQVTVDPELLAPRAEVVIHLTDTTLAASEGLVRSPGLRPLSAEWLDDLFGAHHRITVRPVIDANHQAPSDAYECPPTMREAVELRNPVEVFPWSTRRCRGLDLDHTQPWRPPGGEPGGPTHPDNLGPLTRKAHRAKTHGG